MVNRKQSKQRCKDLITFFESSLNCQFLRVFKIWVLNWEWTFALVLQKKNLNKFDFSSNFLMVYWLLKFSLFVFQEKHLTSTQLPSKCLFPLCKKKLLSPFMLIDHILKSQYLVMSFLKNWTSDGHSIFANTFLKKEVLIGLIFIFEFILENNTDTGTIRVETIDWGNPYDKKTCYLKCVFKGTKVK